MTSPRSHSLEKQNLSKEIFTPRYSLVAQLVKNLSCCNAGDPGSIPGLGTSPGEGKGYPL